MTELRGLPVAESIVSRVKNKIAEKNFIPKLAVVRVGAREDDISYERGILKRFDAAGAVAEVVVLPEDSAQSALEDTIHKLNSDNTVHGILLFRPLPKNLSLEPIKKIISPAKDVDGMGTINSALVYEGDCNAFAPCTAQAVIELLDFYEIDLAGKRVTIIGRSLVVGKPLAMLHVGRNATVTMCHTKTVDLPAESRSAEILIAAAGVAKMAGENFFAPGQIVVDVGINMLDGKLCGDVDFAAAAKIVEAATPVPGGVGTVTTAVLLENTLRAGF